MSSEVGSGHVSIFPVLTGFKSAVTKGTRDAGAAGAKPFEGGFKGVGTRSGRALGKDLKSALSASAGSLGADSMKKFTSEVASASSALARARLKQQDDAGRVRVAETRLAEAVAKSGASSSQAVAAEERLASARRTHASTTEAVSAATTRLKSAQGALAAAQDAGTKSTGRFASGLAGLGRSAQSGFQAVVGAAGRAASAVGSALDSGIRNAATGAVTVAAAGIAVAFSKGFTRLTAIDTARAKLTGLGNDGETVAKIMTNATNAVSGTAFGLGEAASVAAAAVAAQIKPGEQLEKHLKTIANNAAAAGTSMQDMGSIFNKAATQANGVQNDVIGQLADKGIPIYQALADQMGVTAGEVFKLASDGKVSFEMFAAAAEAAAGTVADEIGKTVPGALANIGARLGRIGAGVFGGINKDTGEMFGLYARLGPLLASINAALGPVQARAEKFGELLDKILGPALDWITNLLTKVGQGASLAELGFGALQGVLGPLLGVFTALGAGGLGGLLTKIPLLSSLIPGLTGALSLLGGPLGIAAAAFAGFALSGGDVGALVSSLVGVIDQVVAALPGMVAKVATFIPQLVESILAQIPALLNAAHGIVTALVDGIVQSIPVLVVGAVSLIQGLVDALIANLPTIITGAINLVMALVQGIVTALPLLVQGAVLLVTSLLNGIVAMLPMIIQGGINLLMSLVMGIIQALPVLLQAAIVLVMGLLGAIIDNLPLIIDAGIQLLLSLITGIVNALPQLITAAIELVLQLLAGLLTMLPQLVEAGITLVVSLITGLIKAIPQIIEMLPQIIEAIWNGLADVDWLGLGAQIIQGIIDGFFSMVGSVGDAIGDVLGGILDFFPHSPAKKGPLSATGWRQLRSSGAATMDQFTAGAEDGAAGFGDALSGVAHAAAARAQVAVSAASVTTAASPSSSAGMPENAGISIENHFEHVPFEEAVTAMGQQVSSAARRART